jgi:EAL domain-containing protein (putative c-di-GMP-specific phosphodiesterase class I)
VSLADHYEALVRAAGADPRSITLELTETALMTEAAKALDVLTRLRLKGFGLAIDDFGTGYSSLQQLHSVPFTELKIDQGFVRGSPDHPRRQTIVLGSIDLGRRLKLQTVAEGVETRAEWDLLKGLGCDVAQGYYLSRPLLPEDFIDWAASWRAMVD